MTAPAVSNPRLSQHVALLVTLACVVAALVPRPAFAAPLDPSTVWTSDDPGHVLHTEHADVNGDGVNDAVTAGGHRVAYWVGADTALGNPAWATHYARNTTGMMQAPARLSAVDGATGKNLWTVTWFAPPDAPTLDGDVHIVEGMIAGQIDGDPSPDVLVWRRVHHGASWTSYVELYDAPTGDLEWQHSNPGGTGKFVAPVQVGDRLGAVLSGGDTDAQDPTRHRWEVRIVTAGSDGLVTHARLPYAEGPSVAAKARPITGGFRIITTEMHPKEFEDYTEWWPKTRAIDVDSSSGTAVVRWSIDAAAHHGFYGHELLQTGGSQPLVVYSTRDRLVAVDELTGEEVWQSRQGTDELLGTMIARDVNADGVRDVIVSPTLGHSYWGSVDESDADFASEVHALDGATGATLWKVFEPFAKYGAATLDFADIDGQGGQELVAGFLRNDGFPFYGQALDDPGVVVALDPATGDAACRWTTPRLPIGVQAAAVDSRPGLELITTDVAGTSSALTATGTACEVLGELP